MAADLHALEIEFAKSPTLEACLPLCAAYLAAKRYMEAMVVCKKGIKNAAPTDPRGRIMLAQVILAQAKPQKAEAELALILADFPRHPAALELLGRAHLEQGHRAEAIIALQAALAGDNTLQQAKALLTQLGIAPLLADGPAALTPSGLPAAVAGPAAAAAATPWPGSQASPVAAATPTALAPVNPFAARIPAAASGAVAPGVLPQQPAAPGAVSSGEARQHVGDFFAPTSLGYSNETSGIETAGPGRLTILGFVPKNSGSLKTTAAVFVVIFLAASGFIAYQYTHSRHQKQIGDVFAKIRATLDDDQYGRYREAVALGDKIFTVDPSHALTLSAMAYVHGVLALEHHEIGAQAKAEQLLQHLASSHSEENEFHVAARAIEAILQQNLQGGLKDIRAILHKGGSSPIVELEAFRLMVAAQPEDKETKIQLRRVTSSVVNQARVLNFLGWYFYSLEDNGKAAKYFEQTLQNVKNHAAAKLGRSLVALEQNVGLVERQKDIDQDIKDVLATPTDALSKPIEAMALFTRSQLRLWQKDAVGAAQDFQTARKADPNNALFDYRRGLTLLKLGSASQAVEALVAATGADCKNVTMLSHLIQARTQAKQFSDAHATLARAATIAPTDMNLKLLEAALFGAQGMWPAALAAYLSVSFEAGADVYMQAQLGIGSALLATAPNQAVAHDENLLAKLPDNVSAEMQARLLCQLGQAYESTQNKAKALQSYTFGIDKDRYFPDCHFLHCRLLGASADGKESCKAYLSLEPRGKYASAAAALLN